MAIYFVMIIAALVFVAMPAVYFGQLDGTTAIVLASGTALLVWAAVRTWSHKRKN
jgi:hypothetical protein